MRLVQTGKTPMAIRCDKAWLINAFDEVASASNLLHLPYQALPSFVSVCLLEASQRLFATEVAGVSNNNGIAASQAKMDLDSGSEDGVDSALNFVDEILEEKLGNTKAISHTRTEHSSANEDEEDEGSQSSTEDSDEGSVIEAAPSRRPGLDEYTWVERAPSVPLSVRAPPPDRPWQYKSYDVGIIRIIKEVERKGEIVYVVETRDHRRLEVRGRFS